MSDQPPQLPFPRLPGARFSLFPTDLLFDHSVDRRNVVQQKRLTIFPYFEPDVEAQLDEKVQLVIPPDGGRKAWSFMAGAFLIESITWGFPSAFGTFVDYYSTQPDFVGETILASIGTTATGVATVMSPIGIYLGAKYPHHRKNFMWLGLMCCVGAAAGSAFARTALLLLLLQGAVWGFGTAMIVTPTLSFLVEYFNEKKGLAYGIMFAGSGLSGGTFPFIFSALLQQFGHRVVLLGWAVFSLATLLPIITFIKGNFPLEQIPPVQKTQWKLLKAPLFSILGMTCFLQGFVVYLPGTLLSLYGIDVGLVKWQRDTLLSVRNLSTIFGMPLFGWLADTLGIYIPLVAGSILSSLAVFLLWGFARNFAMLLVFSFVFSVVTGGVVTLRARFATFLTNQCEDSSQELLMFGIMRFLGGGGGIIGGFSTSIFIPDPDEPFTSDYAGGSWKMLIIFVGSVFLVSSLGGFGRLFPVRKDLSR